MAKIRLDRNDIYQIIQESVVRILTVNNPKDYKILSRKTLERQGIDCEDWSNWANS